MGNVQQIIDFFNKLFALFILFFPFNLECITSKIGGGEFRDELA